MLHQGLKAPRGGVTCQVTASLGGGELLVISHMDKDSDVRVNSLLL